VWRERPRRRRWHACLDADVIVLRLFARFLRHDDQDHFVGFDLINRHRIRAARRFLRSVDFRLGVSPSPRGGMLICSPSKWTCSTWRGSRNSPSTPVSTEKCRMAISGGKSSALKMQRQSSALDVNSRVYANCEALELDLAFVMILHPLHKPISSVRRNSPDAIAIIADMTTMIPPRMLKQ